MADLPTVETSIHKCHHCDELLEVSQLRPKEKAVCPRCESTVGTGILFNASQLFCLCLTALILLITALPLDFITINASGNETVISLFDSVKNIYLRDRTVLAIIIFLVVVGIPLVATLSGTILFATLWSNRMWKIFPSLFWIHQKTMKWMMVDVFIIGVLVSLIKVVSLASIELGAGFYLYLLFSICMIVTFARVKNELFWDAWEKHASRNQRETPSPSKPSHHQSNPEHTITCHYCGKLNNDCNDTSKHYRCSRCGNELHHENPSHINNTMALLFTALILFVPANLLPVMSTYYFGEPTHSTILGGVATFLHHGDYFIAAIIFIASVFIPIAKIAALFYLCWSVKTRSVYQQQRKTKLYQLTEILGKWSMIDVFVVIVMVTLIQVGNIIYIRSGFGIIAFTGVVLSTILAAQQFDPRFIWIHSRKHSADRVSPIDFN